MTSQTTPTQTGISWNHAVTQRMQLTIAAMLSLGALCVVPSAASAMGQKLVALDGVANDRLGTAVAVDGDTMVVGAPAEDGGRGAVYVYTRTVNSWKQNAKLVVFGGGSPSLGISVAIDGDTIVAGGGSVGDLNQGAVYTFSRTGAPIRSQTAELHASPGSANDGLGTSVAIDGDTIVAGAASENSRRGSVYTFARTGLPVRNQTAKLRASDGVSDDRLGTSVAIDGDKIVAGAIWDTFGTDDYFRQGSVYTFARTGLATRTETAKLTVSDGRDVDMLGASVAIKGDTIVAGAAFDDNANGDDAGAVYTFARNGAAARVQTAKLTASDGSKFDHLGSALAVDGETIVAGAPDDYVVAGTHHGSLYTFTRTGAASRSQSCKLLVPGTPANDTFGYAVAIDGKTIVGGAPRANASRGFAYTFFAPSIVWNP